MKTFPLLISGLFFSLIIALDLQGQQGVIDPATSFHQVDISSLRGPYARQLFVQKAASAGLYTAADLATTDDEILFYSKTERLIGQGTITRLLEECREQDKITTDTEKAAYLAQRALAMAQSQSAGRKLLRGKEGPGDEGSPGLCEDASVFCGSNVYQYPAGVNSGNGQVGPDYGCLGSTPNPVWYFMQILNPGPITIHMYSTPQHDIDFICWGAFDSPTGACASGLTSANIIDCSYSGSATEDCEIANPIAGKFYLLMITNFSNQACNITFSQTLGTGSTNCDIVINCSMLSITRNVTPCNPATNTFSVSGQMEFSNPPSTGTLVIADNTGISQTFTPPFNSPKAYALNNITCNGATHTLTAHFSADAACTLSQNYTSPQASCPIANIKGGGEICDDGSTIPVTITIAGGIGPYDFTYDLNGTPTTVNGYNGTNYILNTGTPGTYTLVSVQNALCPGTVSGQAIVTLNPLPVISLGSDTALCHGESIMLDAGPGYKNYVWTPGGATTQTLSVTGPGSYSVQVTDFNSCSNSDAIVVDFHQAIDPKGIKHN